MKNVNNLLRSEPNLPKVVDLAAWKAEHLTEPDGGLPESAPERREDWRPIRRGRWTTLDWAELAATLAVIVVFLALAARVLLF